jgi:hypothetical protein
MISVRNTFIDRSSEINNYFGFIQSNENSIEKTVFRVLKANFILMLYNIIEATVSNTIAEIRSHIHNDTTVDFDGLKEKIKKEIIADLKNISPSEFILASSLIANDVIKIPFKKEKISNGNIDNDVLISLSEIYGFQLKNSDYNLTNHGKHLKTIKGKRNDLAHGIFSFTEVGKDYSIIDLENYKNWTINYLKFIIENVNIYLDNKDYKL